MTNVANVQNTESLKDQADVYAGSIDPSYIQSDQFEGDDANISDTSSISSGSKPCINSSITGQTPKIGSEPDESANYIVNKEETPPPPPPEDSGGTNGASNDSDAIDLGGDLDSELDDIWDGFNEEDMWTEDPDTGFWTLNEDSVAELSRRLLALLNLRLLLAMMLEQKKETRWVIFESFSNMDFSDIQHKSSLVEPVAKSNQKVTKELTRGITLLAEKIQEHNDEVMAEAQKDAEDNAGNGWTNFWTCNGKQQDAMEDLQDAYEDYQAALQDSINSLNNICGGAFQGVNSDIEGKGDDLFNDLINSDDYVVDDGNGFIDTGLSKQWVIDLRSLFVGLLAMNRIIVSQDLQKESVKKMISEAFSGKAGLSNRMAGVEDAVEAENSYQTGLFDHAATQILMDQNLDNQIEYLDRQIQKLEDSKRATGFANFFKALAIVAAIVVTVIVGIFTCGGGAAAGGALTGVLIGAMFVAAGAGVLSAVCDYAAAEISDKVNDQFDPTLDTYTYESDGKYNIDEKNHILDKSAALEDAQNDLLASIGSDQIDTLGDDFLTVDNLALTALNKRLTAIQNVQRLLAKMIKKKGQNSKQIFRAFTSISHTGKNNTLLSNVNSILRQGGIHYQALASNLTEYTNAKNSEIEQAHAMEAARTAFWVNIVCSVVGAFVGAIGGPMGAAIGFAAGQALGNAIAGIVNSYRYNTRDTSYDPGKWNSNIEASNGVGSSLDVALNDIYSDLLANGTCSSGDGNKGINTDVVLDLQSKLEGIMLAVANMTAIIEGKASVLRAIWQGNGVVTDETVSMKDGIKAIFESSMRDFSLITSALKEHVAVHNRANAAQQVCEKSWWIFGTTVALLAVAAATGGGISTALGSFFVTMANTVQAIIEFAFQMARAKDDTGLLRSLADPRDASDTKSGNTHLNNSEEMNILNQVQDLESEIQMDSGMISDVGSDNWGINTGLFTSANKQLDALNRIREMIASVMAQTSAIKGMISRVTHGAAPSPTGGMEMSNYIVQNMSAAMLNTQLMAVQQYVARHNQISAAERQAAMAGISMGFALLSTGLSAASLKCEMTIEDVDADIKASKTQPSIEPDYAGRQAAIESSRPFAYASIACTFLGGITNFVAALSMYAANQDAGTESSNNSDNADAKDTENVKSPNAALNYGAAMDGMQADATQSSMNAGAFKMDAQFTALMSELDKSLNRATEGMIKDVNSGVQSTFNQIDTKEALVMAESQTQKEIREAAEELANKAAMMDDASARMFKLNTDIAGLRQQLDDPHANTSALIQQIDMKMAELATEQAKIDKMNQEAMNIVKDLDKKNEKMAKILIELTGDKDFAKHPDLPDALVAHEDPESVKTAQLQKEQKAAAKKSKQATERTKVEVKGKEVEVEVSTKGVTIHLESGATESLTEYVKRRMAEDSIKDDEVLKVVDQKLEVLGESAKATQTFGENISNSKALADSTELTLQADAIMSEIDQTNSAMESLQDGKSINDMKPEELQGYYEKIYKEIFEPMKGQLQKKLAEKQEILAQIKQAEAEINHDQKARLEVQLNEIKKEEGRIRSRIRAFNKHVGVINGIYLKKTDGKNLTLATPSKTTYLAPTEESGKVNKGAKQPQGTAKLAPSADPVDTAELSPEARADQVVEEASKFTNVIQDENGNVQKSGGKMLTAEQAMTEIDELEGQLKELEASENLSEGKKAQVRQARQNLAAIKEAMKPGASSETVQVASAAAIEEENSVNEDVGAVDESPAEQTAGEAWQELNNLNHGKGQLYAWLKNAAKLGDSAARSARDLNAQITSLEDKVAEAEEKFAQEALV